MWLTSVSFYVIIRNIYKVHKAQIKEREVVQMNKDFKYLLEFKEYIDEEKEEFKLSTPPDWNKMKKSRVVRAMLEQGIIKQANDSLTRPTYVATNCNNNGIATNCNNNDAINCNKDVAINCNNNGATNCNNSGIVTDSNSVAELLKENADLKKVVDDLTRKVDGLQRALDSEHNGYLKWRDKYNDMKEEKDRLEILLNR